MTKTLHRHSRFLGCLFFIPKYFRTSRQFRQPILTQLTIGKALFFHPISEQMIFFLFLPIFSAIVDNSIEKHIQLLNAIFLYHNRYLHLILTTLPESQPLPSPFYKPASRQQVTIQSHASNVEEPRLDHHHGSITL